MKKIYGAVSDLILPAAVFLAVLAIFAGTAIFSRIGERMQVQEEDYSLTEDAKAIESLCAAQAPRIECVGKKIWNAGESIAVGDTFRAVSADGRGAEVDVLDIIDQNGDSAMDCYGKESGQAIFPQRGVYTFSLRAMDVRRKRSYRKISLLVDGRGQAP